MYSALKPLIFKLSPENAHMLTIQLLRLAGVFPPAAYFLERIFKADEADHGVNVLGLRFRNPIGLAAGYDKDGLAWRGLAALGFGHLELGTVTPLPQPGNPQPRLFRLPEDNAVINRMGFNNRGADYLAHRLRHRRRSDGPVIGVNIGKNKVTPLEDAGSDYLKLVRIFAPLADYLTVNVSSPNTPGLRTLQKSQMLAGLLGPLVGERSAQAKQNGRITPILVKLAPDLEREELEAALDAVVTSHMDGVIMGNTTLSRNGLHSTHGSETGGLSGEPLRVTSLNKLKETVRFLNGRLPVVASGGISNTVDVQACRDAGACLFQIYTGLIYQGPGLVKQLLNGMVE